MERDLQVQAVVTGTRRYGELHKSVTLLSPQLGLVQAVVFGGRKGKKTSLAPLFSFGTFQIYHNPVRNEYSVTESDCTFLPSNITQDLRLNATASYFCEVCSRIGTDSPEEVYNLMTKALTALESNPDKARKVLIDFTWQMLMISGVGSDMKTCPGCDRRYSDEQVLEFSGSMLTPVCRECSDNSRIVLLPGSRRYLSYTSGMTFEEAFDVTLYDTAQARLSTFLISWMSAFCQWPLKTVSSGLL